jgi:hypothetical protein
MEFLRPGFRMLPQQSKFATEPVGPLRLPTHDDDPGCRWRGVHPSRAVPANAVHTGLCSAVAPRGDHAAIHRITPHRFCPCIPIVGTRSTSPLSALCRVCSPTHRRHSELPIFGTLPSPAIGTDHTILIDIRAHPFYTRAQNSSWFHSLRASSRTPPGGCPFPTTAAFNGKGDVDDGRSSLCSCLETQPGLKNV